jgi:hypothetical protein
MTYPEIKLVDAPSATAAVLFDFNDTTATPKRSVNADDFTIGVPELQGDVDAIDPLYGERLVSFTCQMTGTKAQVAAAQSTLSRRLLAPGQGWLWVRMTPTSRLLFFRTYRAQPADLSFDLVQTTSTTKSERWELRIDLPCEPFAYGELVTQAAATLSNDPTTGTNPQRVVLPAITGDAPAPLRLRLAYNELNQENWALFALHAGATSRPPINVGVGTSDGLTAGTDTTTVTAGVANTYIGGSYKSVSFATQTGLSTRLLGNLAAVEPGRYRIFIRAGIVAPGGGVTARNTFNLTVFGITSTRRYSSTNTNVVMSWLDFGDFELPPRRPTEAADVGPNVTPSFSLGISRESTGGTVSLDHILIVPVGVSDTVESRIMRVYTDIVQSGQAVNADARTETAWVATTATGLQQNANTAVVGVMPRGIPGAQNVLTVLLAAPPEGLGPIDDDLTNYAPVLTVSYYPRFLYIGDS